MTVVYEDEWVTLIHGDWRVQGIEVLGGQKVDAIVTDPPYGETSLEWDRWPKGWPSEVASITDAMWCFGSFRMFHDNAAEFADWNLSQEIVWEKHNGSGFHADRFKRVHELAVLWYQGEWADLRHETPTTADATPRTVRRKTRPTHTGHIEASAYRSEDGGPRLMRSVQYVRSEHGRAIHPTQKPEGIVAPLIEYSVPPGGARDRPIRRISHNSGRRTTDGAQVHRIRGPQGLRGGRSSTTRTTDVRVPGRRRGMTLHRNEDGYDVDEYGVEYGWCNACGEECEVGRDCCDDGEVVPYEIG